MGNKKEKTTVKWWDAVAYYNREGIHGKLSPEVTVGEIVREEKEYIIIKNPKTKNYNPRNHRGIPKEDWNKKPTYLYVPKGMIEKTKRK